VRCDAFLENSDRLLDGSLEGADRDAALRHLEECADCRVLLAALAEPPQDPDLSEAILARTSGAACGSARERLCAWIDGELDPFDAELMAGHLRSCPDCGGLARALERAAEELPRLAALDPGPGFVEAVLARTSLRPRPAPLRERIASALAGLVERPRLALEGAFVATVLLYMVAGAPDRAVDVLRNPVPEQRLVFGKLRGAVDDLHATFVGGAREAWNTTEAAAVGRWEEIRRRFGTMTGSGASVREDGGAGTGDRAPDAAQEKRR
jgi:anti-sigma factor RsiW